MVKDIISKFTCKIVIIFLNDQCTQEAGTQTVSSSEKEEHHFTEQEALNHSLHSPLQNVDKKMGTGEIKMEILKILLLSHVKC